MLKKYKEKIKYMKESTFTEAVPAIKIKMNGTR